jgi:hypothetical protein
MAEGLGIRFKSAEIYGYIPDILFHPDRSLSISSIYLISEDCSVYKRKSGFGLRLWFWLGVVLFVAIFQKSGWN